MRRALIMPELGLDAATPVQVSMWLVKRDAAVVEGERLLEVVAGSVTVDLPAPISGTLVKLLVGVDERLTAGQRLAIIEAPDEA